MSAQPHPYDLYHYNNGNDRDFYFTKVPYSVSHKSNIYTPINYHSLWNHYDIAEEIADTARRNRQQIGNIPRTFNIDHLKEINRLLGEGILPSAGELRVVDLFINEEASYANVGKLTHSNIFNSLEEHINNTDLSSVSKQNLATILGNTHTCLSYTHPFRFNNKQTINIFIDHIVNKSPYSLEFKLIPRELIDKASMHSAIDAYNLNKGSKEISIRPGEMGKLYWNMLTPKTPQKRTANQAQQKKQARAHDHLAKRIPPPGHYQPGPPHLGR